jgi:hypothetical protein
MFISMQVFRSAKLTETCPLTVHGESKAIPLQAWTGAEGSRRLRLPDLTLQTPS